MIEKSVFSNITAGFVAVLIGFTSSAVIVFEAARAAGGTSVDVSAWIMALGVGMGISTIGLSFYYRMPILTVWSTPGAALLATSLAGINLAEATGAFIFSGFLMFLVGATGWFEKVMAKIPRPLTSAMLAGILFRFGTNLFVAMENQFALIASMFFCYLIGKYLFPRYVILVALFVGITIAGFKGIFQIEQFHFNFSEPVFTFPVFSWSVLLSIGLPLFVVTMASQNIPGIAVLQASGYKPPISPLISWTGFTTLVFAPFGGFAYNLAAITGAICTTKEADPNPLKRYRASMWAGIFYLVAGLLGATVVSLFAAFPKELVAAVAGLALLSTIGASLKVAVEQEEHRESAIITFLVSASGITLFGISAAFWGLLVGILGYTLSVFVFPRK